MPLPPLTAPPTAPGGAAAHSAPRLDETTNAPFAREVEWNEHVAESWGSTSCASHRFVVAMDEDTRDLINHLGSELARVMENASATSALLRGAPYDELGGAIETLVRAADRCQALAGAMRALAGPA